MIKRFIKFIQEYKLELNEKKIRKSRGMRSKYTFYEEFTLKEEPKDKSKYSILQKNAPNKGGSNPGKVPPRPSTPPPVGKKKVLETPFEEIDFSELICAYFKLNK